MDLDLIQYQSNSNLFKNSVSVRLLEEIKDP